MWLTEEMEEQIEEAKWRHNDDLSFGDWFDSALDHANKNLND